MTTPATDNENIPNRRMVSFDKVEVLEFPFVAGEYHPSHHDVHEGCQSSSGVDPNALDSASIAMSWTPQARSSMGLDMFEEQQKSKRRGSRLRRTTRAFRKRL
jgi:hypothetical protein